MNSKQPTSKWTYVPRKVINIPRLNPEEIKKQLHARAQELIEESLNPSEDSESENEDESSQEMKQDVFDTKLIQKINYDCKKMEDINHLQTLNTSATAYNDQEKNYCFENIEEAKQLKTQKDSVDIAYNDHKHEYYLQKKNKDLNHYTMSETTKNCHASEKIQEEKHSHVDEHVIKILEKEFDDDYDLQIFKPRLTTVFEEATRVLNHSLAETEIESKENHNNQILEPLNLSKDFGNKHESFSKSINKKNDSFDLDFSALTINTPDKKKAQAILMPKINIILSTPKNMGSTYDNRLHTPLGNNMSQNRYSVSKPVFKTPKNNPMNMPTYSARKLPTPFQNGVKRTPMHCKTLPETMPNERNLGPVKSCTIREDEFNRICVNNVEYLVMNILGKGGSSEVFHCFNSDSRQHVAIKCVSLSNSDTATGYINEVKLLESLQRCDRIIKMHSYEIHRDEEKLLVVLEKGSEDLSSILKQLASKQSHLPMYMVLFYWMEMLYAVQQIHMNGVIHSDLKPANFLRAEGGLKLIDFGIASKVQEDMTCVYKSYQEGSSNYISPEAVVTQSTGQTSSPTYGKPKYKVHYKSDVWSLGCILYQLVYRNTPFQHINPLWAKFSAITNPNHKIEYPTSDWVSPRIVNTIKKCLQYDIKARPSVSELIKEYEGILNHI